MKVRRISIPYSWEDINMEDDNLDVFVKTDDGYSYILSVGTPKNLESLMDNQKSNYYGPEYPFIIVKKLTKEIVEEAIKAYAEKDNGYWLKVYHFGGWLGSIDETVFNQLKAKHLREKKESCELDEFDE